MLGLGLILAIVGASRTSIQLVEYFENGYKSEADCSKYSTICIQGRDHQNKRRNRRHYPRGVSDDFNFDYLASQFNKGDVLDFSLEHDILISKNTADRLLLDVGDSFLIYFVQNEQSLARRLTVKGILKQGLKNTTNDLHW